MCICIINHEYVNLIENPIFHLFPLGPLMTTRSLGCSYPTLLLEKQQHFIPSSTDWQGATAARAWYNTWYIRRKAPDNGRIPIPKTSPRLPLRLPLHSSSFLRYFDPQGEWISLHFSQSYTHYRLAHLTHYPPIQLSTYITWHV